MLTKIELENYRCYKKHEMTFRELSIVVGKNNAGKSTLIEALRLVSLVSNRYKNLSYNRPPKELNLPAKYYGVKPSIDVVDFSFATLATNYNLDDPSIIRASFINGTKIEIYINKKVGIHAVIFNKDGQVVENKSTALRVKIPLINILPQIGPLKREEVLLNEAYITSKKYSHLYSDHFRNQLQYADSLIVDRFRTALAKTWRGVRVHSFDRARIEDSLYGDPKPKLHLVERGFVTEVGNVGNGLQMWLQIIWFLSLCESDSVVILDEPDVYLHADMQRKLARLLLGNFRQVIVATHSVDIMSEVEPENILIVSKDKSASSFADSYSKLQAVINNFGSFQNIELLRFWSSRKVIFTEGNSDYKILSILQAKLPCKDDGDLKDIPSFTTSGWSGWERLIGAKNLMDKSKSGVAIQFYSIFDSDYKLPHEIKKRKDAARKSGVRLHIWNRKEIENYLIIPSAIARLINKVKPEVKISVKEVEKAINDIASTMKNDLIGKYMDEIRLQEEHKKDSPGTLLSIANTLVESTWNDESSRLKRVSGKDLISKISEWSQSSFDVPIGVSALAKELSVSEIDNEVVVVLDSVAKGNKFPM